MPEHLPLNKHPLHQAALKHLYALKATVQTDRLYAAQLAAHVAAEYLEEVNPDLIEAADALVRANPMKGHLWLLKASPGLKEFRTSSPREAASMLLGNLHFLFAEKFPSYNPR